MSTTCNIILKIRKEDAGKTIRQHKDLLCGIPAGEMKISFNNDDEVRTFVPAKYEPSALSIKKGAKYIMINNLWSGYVEGGVGEILLKHFDTYEKVLDLVAGGCASYIEEDCICQYGRCTNSNLPAEQETALEDMGRQDYNYLFEDGRWKVERNGSGWHDLEKVLDCESRGKKFVWS